MRACLELPETTEEGAPLGELGDLAFHPDRTWSGRTYIPVTSRTTEGLDVYGFVAFTPPDPESEEEADREPTDFVIRADYTDETADEHPEWQLDLCDEVVGGWRGEHGRVAAMTLVWGRALRAGGVIATAELAGLAVDQCALAEDRFTLLAPDNYKADYLEIHLWDKAGRRLARESLYEDEDE